MKVLPEAFAIASISGLWLPTYWKSDSSRRLYRVYTGVTVILMVMIMTSQLVALVFLTNSVDELAEAAYVFLSGINACVKSVNMLFRRRKIVELRDMFSDWKCIPKNEEEAKLCFGYDQMARYITLSSMTLAELAASCIAAIPLFFSSEDYVLSLRSWQPYEISGPYVYTFTQLQQAVSLLVMACWDGATDVLCSGFMIKICSQLHLVNHRIQALCEIRNLSAKHQYQILRQCVRHQLHISKIGRQLESAFAPGIVAQYLLSSVAICITIYQLTTNRSDVFQIIVMLVYLSAWLVELLMYCWFGNEISIKSLQFNQMISQTNWTELHASSIKVLIIMMIRSSFAMEITCGPFITLSTNTYFKMLKLSYSAFNVIQQSR